MTDSVAGGATGGDIGGAPGGSRGIGRASALLASGTIVSRALGFVKVFALSLALGNVNSLAGDAYAAATIVPNSIYALIAGGLLSAILVPQIVRASRTADGGSAYINKIVTLAGVAFAVIALVATLSAPLLMMVYGAKPEALGIATAFAFWSLPQVFFLGMYTVLGEVLNARRSFGPFTWAPVANNVVGIAAIGVFLVLYGQDRHDPGVFSPAMVAVLAGGATLGIAVQAFVLVVAWRRTGISFRPDFRWRGVNLGATGRAAGWTFGMLVASQIAGLIETNIAYLASDNGASVSTMSTAWLIFMLPHSIITVSLITVFYPSMSEHAASGDFRAVRGDIGQALRIVLLVLVMADAALLAAALPFARFFTTSTPNASAMAAVIMGYLAGLIPFTILFVVQRAFYALGDTRTPFFFTGVQVVLVVGGTVACQLLPLDQIAAGIAVVVSLGGTVQVVVAAVLLRRRIGGLGGAEVRYAFVKYVLAAIPACAAGIGALALLGGYSGGWAVSERAPGFIATMIVCIVVAVVYLVILKLLRSTELQTATDLISARFLPASGR